MRPTFVTVIYIHVHASLSFCRLRRHQKLEKDFILDHLCTIYYIFIYFSILGEIMNNRFLRNYFNHFDVLLPYILIRVFRPIVNN